MKKKILALLLSGVLAVSALAGCGSNSAPASSSQEAKTTDVRIAALKGPTSMSMVKLMEDSENKKTGSNNYTFSIAGAADEITPQLIQGELDMAAVPANLGAVLSKKTEGKIQVLAINTLGIIYIVEDGNTVKSVADLKGKTIYASGKGATPEYALNFMLKENGIDPEKDVKIEYKSEHTECLTALTTNKGAVAMLPQPFVTTAQMQNSNIRVALDMTKEWEDAAKKNGSSASLLTGVVIARKEFVEQNQDAVNLFLQQYEESVKYTNEKVDDASKLIESYGIVKEAVAKKAIPACNIVFIAGQEMKDKLSGYLTELHKQNPAAVGGEVPKDDFYYIKK